MQAQSTELEHSSENQARSQVAYIVELFDAYRALNDGNEKFELEGEEFTDTEEIEEKARENALSVEVRSGWTYNPNNMEAEEFRIVLCTGGPHVEIQGDLDQYHQADRFRVLHQDWGTPLTEYFHEECEAVEWFCNLFYYDE